MIASDRPEVRMSATIPAIRVRQNALAAGPCTHSRSSTMERTSAEREGSGKGINSAMPARSSSHGLWMVNAGELSAVIVRARLAKEQDRPRKQIMLLLSDPRHR